jgi:hypothetical protein
LGKIVVPVEKSAADTNGSAGPAVLSYLGYNRVTNLFGGDDRPATPTLVDSRLAVNGSALPASATVTDTNSYTPPSPRQYFAHFVDHHDLFTHFLEAIASALWGQSVDGSSENAKPDSQDALTDQRAVWNTLLELYLVSTKSSDLTVVKASKAKALTLLSKSETIPYDPMHALVLCSTSGFTEGLVGIWESMEMYEDILRFFMEQPASASADDPGHPSDQVVHYLNLYGSTNLHLYPLVLRYLTSSPLILSRHSSTLPTLLRTIDEHHILPPLAVIQLLSRNSVSTVGSVKDWLKEKVELAREEVGSDMALVTSYRGETEVNRKEISSLADEGNPEVFQVTRCASCGGQLDLPAIHFMCKHSYHQR